MTGPVTWIIAIVVGAATVLGIEAAFRGVEHAQIAPLAQAFGFTAAWLVAWPYARNHLRRNPRFVYYLMAGVAPSFLIAALRIAFRTG